MPTIVYALTSEDEGSSEGQIGYLAGATAVAVGMMQSDIVNRVDRKKSRRVLGDTTPFTISDGIITRSVKRVATSADGARQWVGRVFSAGLSSPVNQSDDDSNYNGGSGSSSSDSSHQSHDVRTTNRMEDKENQNILIHIESDNELENNNDHTLDVDELLKNNALESELDDEHNVKPHGVDEHEIIGNDISFGQGEFLDTYNNLLHSKLDALS